MSKKRQSFSSKLKSEIANAYASGKLTSKEIEAKGIRMGNVHRWVHEFVPAEGGVAFVEETAPAASELNNHRGPPSSETGVVDIRQLTKRQLKRGPNGRYAQIVKDSATKALESMSVKEVGEITGVNEATLYLWKNGPKKKDKGASPGTSLVPAGNGHGNGKGAVPAVRHAELLVNPTTTDALLVGIRKSEGFANLEKAVKQLKAAHRAGLIEDYDEIDLRVLLGHRQLTGGGLRSRK